jgi:hypothetical protein
MWWFENLYIGGTSAANALVSIVGGNFTVDGKIVLIGANGIISIDPAPPLFSVIDDTTHVYTSIDGSGVTVEDQSSGTNPQVSIAPNQLLLTNSSASGIVRLADNSNDGYVEVYDATAAHHIVLNGTTGLISTTDGITASGTINGNLINSVTGYEYNGAAGVSSGLVGVLVNFALVTTVLQYKDWAGTNQSISVGTGYTLTTQNQVFQGGIRTT